LLTILLTKYRYFSTILLFVVFFNNNCVKAQEIIQKVEKDSISIVSDTIPALSANDSLRKSTSKNAIESKIDYSAVDSIRFNIKQKKVYLYNTVDIKYEDINLKAGIVDISFDKNAIYAEGIKDSAGTPTQKPAFSQGDQKFTATSMTYNYVSKKGLIKDIFTNEGESYLHGKTVKKYANNVTDIKVGSYTTCSEPEPHFEMKFTKAKVVPDDKIVTGPAYLVVEGVPTPLVVPFGFFPNKRGRLSGILVPTYGQVAKRGFYFADGGYYWGISDYVDLAIRGDIFTRGSWALKGLSNYAKRYRYNGLIDIRYAYNKISELGFPDFQKYSDFSIKWQHTQNQKSHPNTSFSADVNIYTRSFNKYNPANSNNYLSNEFNSSIAYQKSWGQGKYNLAANLGYRQNTLTKQVVLKFPEISFSVARFTPFRKKNKVGALKWYDNISVNYVLNAQNTLNTYDSLLLTNASLRNMQNGFMHSIPISSSIKLLKFFTLTNSITYTERWYLKTIRKDWDTDTRSVYIDTVERFQTERDFYYSASLNTRIYGMFQLKKGPLKAVRHVMTPNVGFIYRPNFGDKFWGYYKNYQKDTLGNTAQYSIFEQGIYGGPPNGKSGKVTFSLSNNLEAKVRSKKDTVTGTKKVVLIDNLTLGTGYDMAKDTLRWDYLSISGRTKLFKTLDITYASSWDPYAVDSNGSRINKFEWDVNKRLFRKTSSQWQFGLNWSLNSSDFNKKKRVKNENDQPQQSGPNYEPSGVIDFDNPWNLTLSYSLILTNQFNAVNKTFDKKTIHTINLSGGFDITKKMKLTFNTGYDLIAKQITYSKIEFSRDLHCWEMVFSWIPLGNLKSYNFTLRIKASFLQDVKLEKKTDYNLYQ
jgi:lipopolysaccharide assembly outer membrane protein LptD (OstA)